MNRIDIDVANIKAALTDIVAAYPEIADDEDLAIDTFEGQTNLFEITSFLVKSIVDDDVSITGLGKWLADMSFRKRRFEQRKEAKRKLIQVLMVAGNIDKLPLPEATITKLKGRMKVIIKDINELSQGYYKTERKADMAAIKKDLEGGVQVPGAYLEQSPETITIRTK